MEIQIALQADLETILQLQYLCYRSEAELLQDDSIPPLRETLNELNAEYERGIILKAETEERVIIGSVRGTVKDGTLYIGKLMVHPDYQNQGLGKRLLAAMEQQFPEYRYELFTSDRSLKNLAFYRKQGYTDCGEKQVNDHLKLIYLEKKSDLP